MREQLKRLGDVHDFTVASDDPDVRGWTVRTRDGQEIGQVTELIVEPEARKVRYLEVALDRRGFNLRDEKHVSIPIESAQLNRDNRTVQVSGLSREAIAVMPESEFGTRHTATTGATAAGTAAGAAGAAATKGRDERTTIPRTEEELRVGRRAAEVGEVVVGKHTETEHVTERVPVERERVRVERRPVEGDARAAEARFENDEIRVPVVEEEIVTEKRPVVKEELVVGKERVEDVQDVEADLRKERFDVRKEGHVVEDSDRPKPRRGGY